jgi:hypothetical protein
MSNEGKRSRGDHLTATTPDGKIELTEEELGSVSGGTGPKMSKYTRVRLETLKNKVD